MISLVVRSLLVGANAGLLPMNAVSSDLDAMRLFHYVSHPFKLTHTCVMHTMECS